MGVALLLFFGAYVAYEYSELAIYSRMEVHGVTDCQLLEEPQSATKFYAAFNVRVYQWMVLIYVLLVLVSLGFYGYQKNLSYRYDEEHSTHEDYCTLVEGLPGDATDPVELQG